MDDILSEVLGSDAKQDAPIIDAELYSAAIAHMGSPFHQWCLDMGISQEHLKSWHVGSKDNETLFFYADKDGIIRNRRAGKYNMNGQCHNGILKWMRNPQNGAKHLMPLYGIEHLKPDARTVVLAIDEAQAIVGSHLCPEYLWLSYSGGKGLSDDKIRQIDDRKIYLLRNADKQTTVSAEKKLIYQKLDFKVIDLWKNDENPSPSETIIDVFIRNRNIKLADYVCDVSDMEALMDAFKGLSDEQVDDVLTYGFYENKRYYFRLGESPAFQHKSNFIINPLFHIKGGDGNKRLIELHNIHGDYSIIDAPTDSFVSVANFKKTIEEKGAMLWYGSQTELDKIKQKIYPKFSTAHEIGNLGWQPEGFWAWVNGTSDLNNRFAETDEYGMVKVGDTHFFIPAMSNAYLNERGQESEDGDLYADDRHFIYNEKQHITQLEYFQLYKKVHGENGMIGLAYLLATLNRDYIQHIFKSFPMLFLYGKPGSGKSTLALSMISFFGANTKPFMLNGGTDVAFYRRCCQYNNGMTWYDEYSASIDAGRKEGLKNFYDGVSREVGEKTRSNKTRKMGVRSGVVISGQEFPDIAALFTRVILAQFQKTDYTEEMRLLLAELRAHEDKIITYITAKLVSNRPYFEKHFFDVFTEVMGSFNSGTDKKQKKVPDHSRVVDSYQIMLAVWKTLEKVIDLPYTYAEFEHWCAKALLQQSTLVTDGSETKSFWDQLAYCIAIGTIKEGEDFVICPGMLSYPTAVTKNGQEHQLSWKQSKTVLAMQFTKIYGEYAKSFKTQSGNNKSPMTKSVLKNYLTSEDAFLGASPSHMFMYMRTSAYLFDYEMLEKIGVNLEISKPKSGGEQPEPELAEGVARINEELERKRRNAPEF